MAKRIRRNHLCRDVVESKMIDSPYSEVKGKLWELTLECGHVVTREVVWNKGKPMPAPKRIIECEKCWSDARKDRYPMEMKRVTREDE